MFVSRYSSVPLDSSHHVLKQFNSSYFFKVWRLHGMVYNNWCPDDKYLTITTKDTDDNPDI